MDRAFAAGCLALCASPTLSLALRARSLGLSRGARLVFLLALLFLLAGLGGTLKSNEQQARDMALAIWSAGVALCGVLSFAAFRASQQRSAPGIAERLRFLSLGFCGLGAACAAFVVTELSARSWDNTEVAVAFVCVLILLATVAAAGLGLAARHAARGARGLAWVGRGLALWSLACVVLPVLAVLELLPSELAAAALWLFPVALPLATRLLVGSGPEPLDLALHVSLRRRTRSEQIVLATLCLLTLGAQALTFSEHYARCGGALVAVPAPPNWRALPQRATYDEHNRLGPFVFRASHLTFKGYPAAYQDAKLGDPRLCFGSAISLRDYFEGDIYRHPYDLRLRTAAGGGLFLVSALVPDQGEQLLASFRRDVSARGMFDSEFNARLVIIGVTLLGLGCAGALRVRSRARREPNRFDRLVLPLSVLCLLGSLFSALLVRQHWAAASTPTPGREIAEASSWLI